MFTIVTEDFASRVKAYEVEEAVDALMQAEEYSKVHDIDFVIILQQGFPIYKYQDGVRSNV